MGSDMEVLRFEEGETIEFRRTLLNLDGEEAGEFVVILTWLGTEESGYENPRKIQIGLTQHYSLFVDIGYLGDKN